MSSITFILSSSLIMLLILSGFSSATINEHPGSTLLKGSHVLKDLMDKKLNTRGASDSTFRQVISDLCIYYQTIDEYREVTANDTSNITKALHIVLNETYSDSCQWLKEKLQGDYNCTDMSSIDVTEICTIVEAYDIAKNLTEAIPKTPNDGSFTIECENGNCESVCALLGKGVCGCNSESDTKSSLTCN